MRTDLHPLDELRFGFSAGSSADTVRRLEALPIHSLWLGGHVASTNPTPEVMMQLARVSAWSERCTIGTSILLLPLYSPAIIAKQVADLDRASGGRVILGVGVGGEYPQEFRACGIPIEERGSRTNEAIPLLRRLWTAEPVTHEGRFYPMADVKIHPAPLQPGGPEIPVSGRQPVAMRRAAALGDGWMPYLFSPRRYADSVGQVKAHAEKLGRDLTGFGWYCFVFIHVGDDSDASFLACAEFMGGNYRQDFRQMVSNVAVAGTPDQVVDRLQQYVAAGARHFIFTPASRDNAIGLAERIAGEIIPRLTLNPAD